MNKPRICGVITGTDPRLPADAEPFLDMYEVRIDLIGSGWQNVARGLGKPWIACNRLRAEGGNWRGSEEERISVLLSAIELGASIVDIELAAQNLNEIIGRIRGRTQCLVSFHDFQGTPGQAELESIIKKEIKAGADICKVVTTAHRTGDNSSLLKLVRDFPVQKVVSFCMGQYGAISRILLPLIGGHFTYTSLAEGAESAAGQITAVDLKNIYGMMESAG
jgi:3-dehydroquinate dehydratase type I